jgi:hypothetical protein
VPRAGFMQMDKVLAIENPHRTSNMQSEMISRGYAV